jgi:two-component system cell cycle sensor histidine kinase/response regulator CckA
MLRNLSIRARLTAIILGITLTALAVGFALVGVREVRAFRAQRLAEMGVIAEMVSDASVSAMAFGDAEDASSTLARLEKRPDIEAAVLYAADGTRFATYERPGGTTTAPWPERLTGDGPDGAVQELRDLRSDVAVVRIPVHHDGEDYGWIEVVGSNAALTAEIRSFVVTLAGTALVMVVIAVAAAWLLQRRITRPLFQLADVARRISGGAEPSLRAPTGHGGEIGALAGGFNAMLAELESRSRELVASREALRALIDGSPVAIIGIDARGTVTLWNPRAAAIFGHGEGAAIGRAIADVIPAEALTLVWGGTVNEPGDGGVDVELDDGRVLAVVTASLPGGDGVAMVADITERRRAAEALEERSLHLQRAQKMEVVGRLAGGVAHDFNNLLTVVMASCQMLFVRSGGKPELKGYVDNIQNAAQRGAALSRRLLAFSKQQSVDARPIDVRAVVTDLEKMVRCVVSEHVSVKVDLIDIASVVMVDQGQLEQVLLNMVLNARDAMASGGTLTVRTRVVDADCTDPGPRRSATGSWCAVSVIDTGTGMSEETRARVFEPFFTTKTHGTGLGLATAMQIVNKAGGEITVSSRLGTGTTFTIWLPRLRGAETFAGEVMPSLPLVGDETVLVAEDQADIRNLIQIALVEAGYHVIAAATPAEALAMGSAPGISVDILLTDVVMPGMSGPVLAAELLRRRPDIEVLYMSGYVGDALTQHGLDETAAALIHKPFKPDQLLQMIRTILDARPSTRARRQSQTVGLFGHNDSGEA